MEKISRANCWGDVVYIREDTVLPWLVEA